MRLTYRFFMPTLWQPYDNLMQIPEIASGYHGECETIRGRGKQAEKPGCRAGIAAQAAGGGERACTEAAKGTAGKPSKAEGYRVESCTGAEGYRAGTSSRAASSQAR